MIRNLMIAGACACLTIAWAGSASASWLAWFDYERPVIYRPITTAQTVYFQPAPVHYGVPRRFHYGRDCSHPTRHRRAACH